MGILEDAQEKLMFARQHLASQNLMGSHTRLMTSIKKIMDDVEKRHQEELRDIEAAPKCVKHGCSTYGGCQECYREWQEEERKKAIQKEIELKNNYMMMLREHPEKIMAECGIPALYISEGITVDKLKLSKQKSEYLKNWAANPNTSIFISGTTGTGKTTLACALMREIIASDKRPIFKYMPDVFSSIKHSFSGGSDMIITRVFGDTNVMTLDDIGAFQVTEWSVSVLEQIIDLRYREMLPTIITSNLDLDKIGSLISDRIASRISTFKIMNLDGDDYRKVIRDRRKR